MRPVLLLVLCAGACGDGSGFAGHYEAVSSARGACDADPVDEPVAPQDLIFRLDDVDVAGGTLVAYYACVDRDTCEDLYDLARSFGRAKDDPSGWAGYVSSAIPSTGCILTHRIRRLRETSNGVQITTDVYRENDGTLMGAACDQAVAAERATTMPCVEHQVLAAEAR